MRHGDEDVRLAERAIRGNWPMSDERRAKFMDILDDLASDPRTKPRQRITAIKAALMAETVNAKLHETDIKLDEHQEGRREIREALELLRKLEAEQHGDQKQGPRPYYFPRRTPPHGYTYHGDTDDPLEGPDRSAGAQPTEERPQSSG